jgi:hypothetical protein
LGRSAFSDTSSATSGIPKTDAKALPNRKVVNLHLTVKRPVSGLFACFRPISGQSVGGGERHPGSACLGGMVNGPRSSLFLIVSQPIRRPIVVRAQRSAMGQKCHSAASNGIGLSTIF